MARSGQDLDGEARFIDALLPRHGAVLDAGCGTGRVAAALARCGHRAIGVDRDAGLIDVARSLYPDTPYLVADLLDLTPELLEAAGAPSSFDVVALPGNVMVFVAPGTEREVLRALTSLLRPGGRLVTGFATDREYQCAQFDRDAAAVGLNLDVRFATWQLEPWSDAASWAVSLLTKP